MNGYNRRLTTRAAVILTIGLLTVGQSALAENGCKEVSGTDTEVDNGIDGGAGPVTNAGILNGTAQTVFTSSPLPTPVSTIFSFTGEWTLRTDQGQLKTSNVYILDFSTGRWTAIGYINSSTSTGRFAGATGVLYYNGKQIGTAFPFTFAAALSGEICLAKE